MNGRKWIEKKRKLVFVILIMLAVAIICCVMLIFFKNQKSVTLLEWDFMSDYENIELTVKDSQFSQKESYIEMEWQNGTDKKVYYGDEFSLYLEENGKWKECPIFEEYYIWNDLLYFIGAGTKVNVKYPLGQFGVLKEGNYRIEREYWFEEDSANKYSVEIYFCLGKE